MTTTLDSIADEIFTELQDFAAADSASQRQDITDIQHLLAFKKEQNRNLLEMECHAAAFLFWLRRSLAAAKATKPRTKQIK